MCIGPPQSGHGSLEGERDALGAWRVILRWGLRAEQCPDLRDVGLAACSGQQAVVADADETIGQHVDQKAANKLGGGQLHDLPTVAVLDRVVLAAEADRLVIREIKRALEMATRCV